MDFFELLRFSIGADAQVRESDETDWEALHQLAKEQTLLGVMFCGIERLPKEERPQKRILLKWYAESERIKSRNTNVNEACLRVSRLFNNAGIENCILKGQGNASMYDYPFSRTAGDIDIWINRKKLKIEDGWMILGENKLKAGKQVYHHIEAESVGGICVEVHTRPSFMNNLIHNSRMQKWFEENAQEQFRHHVILPDTEEEICIPTVDFNIVYQLAHISKHIIQDGIGLRQFVDYYYVLKKANCNREKITKTLKQLGLYRLARAVMYVEKELLGLDSKYLVVPVDRKLGTLLCEEIMVSGNFGKYDKRVSGFYRSTAVGRNMERIRRDARLVWYFPSECIWEPVFRIFHFVWRFRNRL